MYDRGDAPADSMTIRERLIMEFAVRLAPGLTDDVSVRSAIVLADQVLEEFNRHWGISAV